MNLGFQFPLIFPSPFFLVVRPQISKFVFEFETAVHAIGTGAKALWAVACDDRGVTVTLSGGLALMTTVPYN
jgi:hypothetical protein